MKIENMEQYRGVYALLLTAFKEDKSVDYDGYAAYVEWQASNRPHYLFPVCGSSEMMDLTLSERLKIAETAVKHSGDVPCFATANLEPSWKAQVEEVKKMEQTGVHGLVFVTKGYANDDDRLVTYLCELAENTTLPILLYEFPGLQPHLMSGKAYGELAKTGRFVGVKDTTCTMPRIKDKIAVQGDTAVMQANIPYLLEAYEAGARGVVATPTSCGAALFRKMYDEFFVAKDYEAAKHTFDNIILLDNAIDSGFCASAKYFCSLQGVPIGWTTRGNHDLGPARLKSLRVFYEYAKANGILK